MKYFSSFRAAYIFQGINIHNCWRFWSWLCRVVFYLSKRFRLQWLRLLRFLFKGTSNLYYLSFHSEPSTRIGDSSLGYLWNLVGAIAVFFLLNGSGWSWCIGCVGVAFTLCTLDRSIWVRTLASLTSVFSASGRVYDEQEKFHKKTMLQFFTIHIEIYFVI